MITIRKRDNFYEYRFDSGKVNGNEMKDISKLLAHSRIGTTENYYITSITNDLIKICESIEKETDINSRDKF